MSFRWTPILLIPLLGLLFFAALALQPDGILYSDYSDFINYHIPCKRFLVRSWQQTGELPLWCPEMFAGMPFVHDVQVAAFYPLNWPLLLVPEQHVGAACSWLIVLHVIIGGLCMYAYARHQGLYGVGALVAALGYMFAGKWLLHLLVAGHFNVAPLAWLPLVLLLLEQAIQRGSIVRATGAGLVFALIILGTHPQLTFYSGLFIAMWTLGTSGGWVVGWLGGERGSACTGLALPASLQQAITTTPDLLPTHPTSHAPNQQAITTTPDPIFLHPTTQPPNHPTTQVRRWLLLGAWTALVAVLVSAIQILPSLDATSASSRTLGVPLMDAMAGGIKGGTRSFIGLVGPLTLADASWLWEERVGLGLVWLALAICALVVVPRRVVRVQAGMALLWLLLGLGGILLLQWLPGFRMWRLPSRMFLLLGLPLGLLAGTAVQALLTDVDVSAAQRERCRAIVVRAAVFILVPLAMYTLVMWLTGSRLQFAPYWLSLALTVPLAWWLVGMQARPAPALPEKPLTDDPRSSIFNPRSLAWLGLLLVDLWALALPLVQVRSEAEVFAPSACIDYLASRANEHGRILDICPAPVFATSSSKTPLWPNFAMVAGVEPVRGYNPLDVRRYKEYLELIIDRDEPLQALKDFTQPGPGGFVLVNTELANLLGVRYLLLPNDVPLTDFVPDAVARQSWHKVFEDPAPHAFNFVPSLGAQDAGLVSLPPYTVYENSRALPRVFVVPEARLLPQRPQLLATLKETDFRRSVLIERVEDPETITAPADWARSQAIITDYRPNSVTIEANGSQPGWLLLTDIWFPGWTCALDDEPVSIYRANYLFRAIRLPPGSHRIEFRFAPRSYEVGKVVTIVTLLGLVLGAGLLLGWRTLRRER